MDAVYEVTHSLLSAWIYALKDNPYEDATGDEKDPFAEFLTVLRREPTEPNEAMQNGLDYEQLVDDVVNGKQFPDDQKWLEQAKQMAAIVSGGETQMQLSKVIPVAGYNILLLGRLDWIKCGTIYDIKFSKSYERGKYYGSTQHSLYFECCPEVNTFTYLVTNGNDVWTETYRRDETADIRYTVESFLSWLRENGLLDEYLKYWDIRSGLHGRNGKH